MSSQPSKAWTYTAGYSSLSLTIITPPSASNLPPSHLLLKLHAAALNPVDIQLMNLPSHTYPWSATHSTQKGTGCDFSGTVLGSSSPEFATGDEVCGLTMAGGTVAEIACVNLKSAVVVKKPNEWSWEQAAAVPLVWLTAKRCIESIAPFVNASESKKVAVLGGSSATGIYCVILAKQKGWEVVSTSSGRNREFVVGELGADTHVDYTSQDVREEVQRFGPVAVVDCVGGTECVGLKGSKRYTTIVGDKTGRSSMGGPYTYLDFWAPGRMVKQWWRWGVGYVGFGESYDVVILGMRKEWLEEAKGVLGPEKCYVDSVWRFEEADKAFERLNTGRAKGKVVVKIL